MPSYFNWALWATSSSLYSFLAGGPVAFPPQRYCSSRVTHTFYLTNADLLLLSLWDSQGHSQAPASYLLHLKILCTSFTSREVMSFSFSQNYSSTWFLHPIPSFPRVICFSDLPFHVFHLFLSTAPSSQTINTPSLPILNKQMKQNSSLRATNK